MTAKTRRRVWVSFLVALYLLAALWTLIPRWVVSGPIGIAYVSIGGSAAYNTTAPMLAVWASLGRGVVILRFLQAICVLTSVELARWWILRWLSGPDFKGSPSLCIYMGVMVSFLVPLLLLRYFRGWRLAALGDTPEELRVEPAERVTIRSLLVLTALVSVTCAIARVAEWSPMEELKFLSQFIVTQPNSILPVSVLILGAAGPLFVTGILSPRRTYAWLPGAAIYFAADVIDNCVRLWSHLNREFWQIILFSGACSVVFLLLGLWIVRLAGYRLVRVKPSSA